MSHHNVTVIVQSHCFNIPRIHLFTGGCFPRTSSDNHTVQHLDNQLVNTVEHLAN